MNQSSPLRRLKFGQGLMLPTLQGTKKITIRRHRPEAHDFKNGDLVIGEFADGLDILIRITADTDVKPFSSVTDAEAREDGFRDSCAAFRGMGKYYEDLRTSDLAAIIRFEIPTLYNSPVVSTNAEALRLAAQEA